MKWPKRLRDLEGAVVLTTKHLCTRGGTRAAAGTRCTIVGTPGIQIRLRADRCPHCCVQFEITLTGPREFKLESIRLMSLAEREMK
jgi:hypothetical protein